MQEVEKLKDNNFDSYLQELQKELAQTQKEAEAVLELHKKL